MNIKIRDFCNASSNVHERDVSQNKQQDGAARSPDATPETCTEHKALAKSEWSQVSKMNVFHNTHTHTENKALLGSNRGQSNLLVITY